MYVFLVTWLHILNSWYCSLLVNVFLPLTVINLSEQIEDEDIIRNKHFLNCGWQFKLQYCNVYVPFLFPEI